MIVHHYMLSIISLRSIYICINIEVNHHQELKVFLMKCYCIRYQYRDLVYNLWSDFPSLNL